MACYDCGRRVRTEAFTNGITPHVYRLCADCESSRERFQAWFASLAVAFVLVGVALAAAGHLGS